MSTPTAPPAPVPAWLDREAYPFAHHWVDLPDGPRMHYVDEGSGDAILFIHGTPTWSFEWRHLIRGLSESNRCVAPDLIGFGLSDRPRDFAYTPEAHAEAIAAFVERLNKIGVDPVCGTSADFAAAIREDINIWKEAVKAAGMK
jgi:hypothetical protein